MLWNALWQSSLRKQTPPNESPLMAQAVEDFITGCMCPHCKKCSRSTVMKTKLEIDTLEDGCIGRTRKCNRCGETFRTHERVVAPEFRKRREKDLIAEALAAKQG